VKEIGDSVEFLMYNLVSKNAKLLRLLKECRCNVCKKNSSNDFDLTCVSFQLWPEKSTMFLNEPKLFKFGAFTNNCKMFAEIM